MTGNPAAPRTEAAGTAPVPYDRGIDPRHTTSRVPRRRAGGDVSASPFRTSLTAGNPMFPDLRESRDPEPEARATRPTERHAGVPPPNGFSFCRSARALDHIGVAEPVKPAAHGPKGPGRRV